MEGLTPPEIAERIRVREFEVVNLIRAALQDLRETLETGSEDKKDESSLEEALTLIA
jgi:DNA-directed RNA polymerase specialized sigma24 family protein